LKFHIGILFIFSIQLVVLKSSRFESAKHFTKSNAPCISILYKIFQHHHNSSESDYYSIPFLNGTIFMYRTLCNSETVVHHSKDSKYKTRPVMTDVNYNTSISTVSTSTSSLLLGPLSDTRLLLRCSLPSGAAWTFKSSQLHMEEKSNNMLRND